MNPYGAPPVSRLPIDFSKNWVYFRYDSIDVICLIGFYHGDN
jgi:hypothetical protein